MSAISSILDRRLSSLIKHSVTATKLLVYCVQPRAHGRRIMYAHNAGKFWPRSAFVRLMLLTLIVLSRLCRVRVGYIHIIIATSGLFRGIRPHNIDWYMYSVTFLKTASTHNISANLCSVVADIRQNN